MEYEVISVINGYEITKKAGTRTPYFVNAKGKSGKGFRVFGTKKEAVEFLEKTEEQATAEPIKCVIGKMLELHKKWLLGEYEGIRADFTRVDLKGENFKGAELTKAIFNGADLRGANFSGANLHMADFRDSNLSGADFRDSNISGANFSGATLRIANLSKVNAYETKFTGADLGKATLSFANLQFSRLVEADLSGANLSCSNLVRADLESAFLVDADMSGATISHANLRYADLCRTQLIDADLNGVDLENVCLPISDDNRYIHIDNKFVIRILYNLLRILENNKFNVSDDIRQVLLTPRLVDLANKSDEAKEYMECHADKSGEGEDMTNALGFKVNNRGLLNVAQDELDSTVHVRRYDSDGYNDFCDIPAGDFVMLMNYYKYIKENDIHNDFINPYGKNLK